MLTIIYDHEGGHAIGFYAYAFILYGVYVLFLMTNTINLFMHAFVSIWFRFSLRILNL